MPSLDSEALAAHLSRTLAPLYAIHGEEPLLALEAADRIRARAREQGYTEREVLTAEQGFDWGLLLACASSLSLFGSRKVVDLRIPGGRPGTEGAQAVKVYCSNLPPDVVTLVSLPRLDRQSLSSGWFEALARAGTVVTAAAVTRERLPQWIAGRLAAQGQSCDGETLQFLADQVEGNLLAAYQEIQKLALLHPAGGLGLDQVSAAVMDVARFDTAQLGQALLKGDAVRLVRVLDGLRGEGAAAPLVLWQMSEEIRAMGRVLEVLQEGKPSNVALREARVWGSRQGLLMQAVKRVKASDIRQAILHAAGIDRMVKGLAPGDPWDELLQLGLRFAAPPAGRSAGGRKSV